MELVGGGGIRRWRVGVYLGKGKDCRLHLLDAVDGGEDFGVRGRFSAGGAVLAGGTGEVGAAGVVDTGAFGVSGAFGLFGVGVALCMSDDVFGDV